MAMPFHHHRPFPVDLHLHISTMEELDSFLLGISQHIDRILHRYTSPPPLHPDPSPMAPTVTRSLLPNIGLILSSSSPQPPSSVTDPVDTCNSASVQQENPTHGFPAPNTVDGSLVKSFLEEILTTSRDWCAKKQKLILEGKLETVVELEPKEEVASAMVCQSQSNTETAQARSSVEETVPFNSTTDAEDAAAERLVVCKGEGVMVEEEKVAEQAEACSDKDGGIVVQKNGEEEEKRAELGGDGGSSKERETGDSYVTPIKPDNQQKVNLSLAEWVPPSSSSDMKIQPYRPPVEIIASPDWLPQGWITELKTRSSGNSAGTKDKYYVEPVSKRRFRSRKEVFNFLETGKLNRYRKRSDTSPTRMLPETESTPATTKQPVKRSKSKTNTPTTTTPVATSSGAMGNMYVPLRSGQPSEWLLYESLASLPFPMFDSLRYVDPNANKSNTSNRGPPVSTTRPWFFTGPEASWMPYSGLAKPSDDKSRDYQVPYSMPTFTPEPQKRRGRRPSKRGS